MCIRDSLQGVTDAPLQLDSTRPEVLEKALRVYCGKAIVNSVNGDRETMEAILPLVKKYGAAVVGLTLDKQGIPKTTQERMDIAQDVYKRQPAHWVSTSPVSPSVRAFCPEVIGSQSKAMGPVIS